MFQIGQHVIHPGQGVCTVTGFTEDKAHPMILLCAKSGHAETHLMYPLAQQDRLHAIISREDAESLLGNYADLPVDTFTERNSALEETHFKQQLKLGAPETVRVAKTMHIVSTRRRRGAKSPAAIMHACSRSASSLGRRVRVRAGRRRVDCRTALYRCGHEGRRDSCGQLISIDVAARGARATSNERVL